MCIFLAGSENAATLSAAPSNAVAIEKLSDRVRVMVGTNLFAEYVFTYPSRPYLYPIYGPSQVAMTRNWPMRDTPGEAHDHPHHRSLWFAHGSVNGIDFWSEVPGAGRIVHRQFAALKSGSGEGVIQSRNDWLDKDGKLVCTDSREMRFSASRQNPETRVLDFEVTIRASEGDLVFGDTKEGTMAIRIAESMRLKGSGGHIVNSEGVRDEDTWGKRAKWCDYYGTVDSITAGVAILDHPSNPRHPTWWHVRDYGLFAANPFGKHDFEKLSEKNSGALTVRKGSSITFKYRFLFHRGNEKEGRVTQEYAAYTAQP